MTTIEDVRRLRDVVVTDQQWEKIRRSLHDVHVDADGVRLVVEKLRVMEGRKEYSLRQGLPRIADGCASFSRQQQLEPTLKQVAAERLRTIELCEKLHAQLDDPENHLLYGFFAPGLAGDQLNRIRKDLATLIPELKRCRPEATATGGRGKHNSAAHSEFWKELVDIWTANVGRDVKWRAKHLANFLIACSEPFFPKEAADGAINAFVERYTVSSK
jgi:hypothetical protein